MSEVKHLLYENGTEQIFTLTVPDGAYAGTYVIEKPDGFDEADVIVDINEDYFNVDNFVLGDTQKINFLQYSNGTAYDIVKKVYDEQGGDGKIIFGWKAKNGTTEYDLLGEGYELNLNKYRRGYEKSMMKIETEIKKREVQNKFLTREDVSVNLFSEKDLDNEDAPALVLDDVYFKEGVRKKGNFYYFDISQNELTFTAMKYFQFLYQRSEGYEIGDNTNNVSGYEDIGFGVFYRGTMISTITELPAINIEISNMEVIAFSSVSQPDFSLYAVIKNGPTVLRHIFLVDFTDISPSGDIKRQELKIVNQTFSIGNLKPNESIDVQFLSNNDQAARFSAKDTSTSIEITSDLTTPLRKTKVIRLKDAIQRIARMYSGVDLPVQSTIISPGGYYYNTAISTGMFMRALPEIYNTNKITTSFKTLFYESASKLLALGFDLQDDKIIVEDIGYFFKDVQTYDFTAKDIIQDEFSIENDPDSAYNQIIFGSKKFSTNKKSDLLNYNTKLEALTPLKSVKTKFDKTIDAIIDEDKISEMILDKSTSTNDNDDDLIIFDVVDVTNYLDEGILSDAVHYEEGGYLWITSYETPFDVLPISVGGYLEITSGLNAGNWQILGINKAKIQLNKTSGIQTGESETPIKFMVGNITKNRTDEGFAVSGVKDRKSATNLRHNPKYQMARWFPFYGSGLAKKADTEEIIVTNYKNNGDVTLKPTATELDNELQGETVFNENETLQRLRENREPFFSGESVEITLSEVVFHEFFTCYNAWRYGENNRGYISATVPAGVLHIYPFGAKAFSFDGQRNELTIRGKVKKLLPAIE